MFIWNTIQKIRSRYYTFMARLAIRKIASSARVSKLAGIFGGENIEVQAGVKIWDYTWIAALSPTKSAVKLVIGAGTVVGRFNHIYASKSVEIGKNVITGDKVYISDNLHEYTNIQLPVKHQPIKQLKEVFIGDGAWIGENVCIIGASVGKNTVIGSSAVVTKDIPDYCVAVGAPARVIKRYDFQLEEWVKC